MRLAAAALGISSPLVFQLPHVRFSSVTFLTHSFLLFPPQSSSLPSSRLIPLRFSHLPCILRHLKANCALHCAICWANTSPFRTLNARMLHRHTELPFSLCLSSSFSLFLVDIPLFFFFFSVHVSPVNSGWNISKVSQFTVLAVNS